MRAGELAPSLLDRAREGDTKAFRLLYEHYAGPVYGFLRRMLRDDAVAEDALQEAFIRVLRALRNFDPDGPARLSTWILGIARRVALRALEKLATRGRETALPEPAVEVQHDLRLALERAVEALPVPQRATFILFECCNFSYEEIATVEEIDVGTVRSRLHRARAMLQQLLRDDTDENNHEPRGNRARAIN